MTMLQALDQIAKNYVVGTVPYYEALKPDPWEENTYTLENQLKRPEHFGPPDFDRYCRRALELIERFKRDGSPATKITNADAFQLGSTAALSSAESRVYRQCRACDSKGPLRIFKINATQVELLCKPCAIAEKKWR